MPTARVAIPGTVLPTLTLALAAPVAPVSAQVADAPSAVTIDGVIDEPAWQAAVPVTDFRKYQPVEGGQAPGRTEVRFLQDDRFLYVAVKVTEVDYGVRARMSQRELINADDQIGLYLDTFDDGRTGYIFYTNALGIQQDIRHNNGTWNVDWDTAYRSKGRVTDDGFELELAFPWRSIRYPEDDEQTWGLIITRKVPGEGAKYAFPDIERNHPRLFQQAAELRGVRPGSRGTGLDLIPALTATASQAPDDPSRAPISAFETLRPSLDARYAITPDIGLAGTVNPDFSQVESDIRDVRLNARFAYQFPERRPFFLDGIDAFQDQNNTLYTRSIDQPIYGVKVSGRQDGVSTGLVHALDRSPLASFHEGGTPGFDADDVDGRQAFTTMARVQKDAFGAGYVGATFADKRVLGGHGHFDIGAIDMAVPLAERVVATWSHAQSIAGDSPSDSLWGSSTQASLRRASGIGTGAYVTLVDRSEGYRNEVGFTTQSAFTQVTSGIDHTLTPGGVVDTITPKLYGAAFEERNEDRDHNRFVAASTQVLVDGIHLFTVDGGINRVREATVDIPGRWAAASYSGQIGSLVEWSPQLTVSRGIDYALLVPADDLDGQVDATLRYAGLRLDTTARVARHVPQGQDPQLATFVRSRLGAQFTRTLGLRLIGEHTQGTELDVDLLRSSILLTWLDVPGTAAYLGYSEDTALGARWQAVERTVFAKVSVLLRP